MTKADVTRWVYGTAAALLQSDLEGEVILEGDPDYDIKYKQFQRLIDVLRKLETGPGRMIRESRKEE